MSELRCLTASSLRDFLTCGEKGRLANIKRIRATKRKATLAFGTTIHASLEKFYLTGEAELPAGTFRQIWEPEKESPYEYSQYDTHGSLLIAGSMLMEKFPDHPLRPKEPMALENSRYVVVGGTVPFYGILDYEGTYTNGSPGKIEILDWKTAGQRYGEHKAALDLQLTSYYYLKMMTERQPDRVGFGVFVKKKREPEIQFQYATRTRDQLREWEKLVEKVWRDVHESELHRVPGAHCSWCDYLPLCLGQKTLEQGIEEGIYMHMPSRARIDKEEEADRE